MVTSYIIEFLNSVEESRRSSAFGYSMLVGGAGAMASPPLSGKLLEIVHYGKLEKYTCKVAGMNGITGR